MLLLLGPNLKSNQDTADSVIRTVFRSVFNKSPGARDSSGALAASVFATRFQKRHCKQIKLNIFYREKAKQSFISYIRGSTRLRVTAGWGRDPSQS